MSTLPEQFSAARKTQVEAQLEFFRKFSSKAVESTEKVIALNLSTSRATLEKSTDTIRQLFAAKDPRDLLALTAQSQESFNSLLAYGRELFSIAAGARVDFTVPAPSTSVPTQLIAASAPVETVVEVQAEPIAEPIAETTPIAEAISQIVPPTVAQPAAAPVEAAPDIVISTVAPVDAPPPKASRAKAA